MTASLLKSPGLFLVFWPISTHPLISKSSSLCTNPLVTEPSAPITTGITVTLRSIVFSVLSQSLGIYHSFRFPSVLPSGQAKRKVHYTAGFHFRPMSRLNNYHHHHVVPPARISLTLSRHFSRSFIASGRSSGLHPVSSHSCVCMFDLVVLLLLGHMWGSIGVHHL